MICKTLVLLTFILASNSFQGNSAQDFETEPSEFELPVPCDYVCLGANETYNSCGSSCGDSCKIYRIPQICTLQCVPSCTCIQNHFRHPQSGICVPQENCPTVKEFDYDSNCFRGKGCVTKTKQPRKCLLDCLKSAKIIKKIYYIDDSDSSSSSSSESKEKCLI